jgi:hypothetical protein
MQGRLPANVVSGQGTPVFQKFTAKNEALLIWRNIIILLLLHLDLYFDTLHSVRGLDSDHHGVARQRQSLDSNDHFGMLYLLCLFCFCVCCRFSTERIVHSSYLRSASKREGTECSKMRRNAKGFTQITVVYYKRRKIMNPAIVIVLITPSTLLLL